MQAGNCMYIFNIYVFFNFKILINKVLIMNNLDY